MIGKPCAGKLHARFDEGELEIERFSHYASSLLYPFLTPFPSHGEGKREETGDDLLPGVYPFL